MSISKSLYSSATDDWATPIQLFEQLDAEFHFTLDVCASKTNAKCKKFFTKEDNGLIQKWDGIVWMNPPYGRDIDKWMQKAATSGTKCVCLVPVRSDTRWWHNYAMQASEIRFLKRRLKFGSAKTSAPFPSAVIIFDPSKKTLKVTAMEVL